ncbi:hypothetical protein GSU2211 [Geobacter sulfurreducens PCA]|uniref:Uncharacterized protein n=1 Tax=Geobacter sulfurreducens (strain ATCC 51573 / DSM 12127 / PCA) TaxID=243231 RepID=Q74AY8_GEOSL|nr:hypothetical protein GSU2211 [Geobacter sulfurreducens PCA]ADN78362.1 hypothetical protein KN400_3466 [Geobacter sulfurreducens KN400]AJY68449.1 hypothetical protein RW64_02000 [Geobacter sulfurreducens]HBB69488.1 hypothetical protein [Geobacter sulfurreducens]HCD94974.1 hypothetical protein [Geobacter sulfurreducens]
MTHWNPRAACREKNDESPPDCRRVYSSLIREFP